MKKYSLFVFLLGFLFYFAIPVSIMAQPDINADVNEDSSEFSQSSFVNDPSKMLKNWLLQQIDQKQIEWQQRYESLKTIPEIEQYQQERIDFFRKQLGTLWDKTPLNPQITGTLEKDGYRVEKILFESLPQFYVTGTFFLPDQEKYQPPYPGLLVVCGHSDSGKAYDNYQGICQLAAINGLAAFIIDPVDQGERLQHLDANGKPYAKGVPAHNLIGSGSILLGRNTATFEIWDMTRALDYMQSRADILPDRLGVAGNSGGGTQTSYIMALDERVFVAAPACYLCNLFDNLTHQLGPQDAEQNIFGQIGFGMDHADYCLMRAPKPTLMCVATQDFFNIDDAWESFRYAKRIFSRWTLAEQMDIIEIDSPHGYGKEFRETTIRWMLRWLANRDEVITEPLDMELLTADEIKSIEAQTVLALPNARTTYDINRDLAEIYEESRKTVWDKMTSEKAADLLRHVAHIRTLNDIPNASLIPTDIVQSNITKEISDDYFLFQTDRGIFIPVRSNFDLMNQSERSDAVSPDFSDENNVEEFVSADRNSASRQINIIISDQGRYDEKVNQFFAQTSQNNESQNSESQNPIVQSVALDLRGWGETQGQGQNYYNYDFFGPDGSEYYLAYLLGTSYVGMRTDDLISIARFFKEKEQCQIHLVAFGLAGNIALHAKIVEPELFESITIEKDALPTWTSLVKESPTRIPLSNVIHGVLAFYDINDLIKFVDPKFFDESTK